MYLKERKKEIVVVKYRIDISFPQAWKIVDSYIKGHTYANIAQRQIQLSARITTTQTNIELSLQLGIDNKISRIPKKNHAQLKSIKQNYKIN